MIMKKVKSKGTKPELYVRSVFWGNGLRYRLNSKALPGKPDLVFSKPRIVVFVNGCFWHRHTGCRRTSTPQSNVSLWELKFANNVRRDEENYRRLIELGWRVIIVWECQIRDKDFVSLLLNAYYSMVSVSDSSRKIHSIG